MKSGQQYTPKYEDTTHIGLGEEEFKIGSKGFLYRRISDEWRKTTFPKHKLLTVEEFREKLSRERNR